MACREVRYLPAYQRRERDFGRAPTLIFPVGFIYGDILDKGGGARELPRFLYLKALKPFISAELGVRVTNPIKYRTLDGNIAYGYLIHPHIF